jgi:hypothetical protein
VHVETRQAACLSARQRALASNARPGSVSLVATPPDVAASRGTLRRRSLEFVSDEVPPDSDLDDLPDELVLAEQLRIRARDPETGELYDMPISKEHVAAAFAD